MVTVWLPPCDDHCMISTLWLLLGKGHGVMDPLSWPVWDDQWVFANVWWWLCHGQHVMITELETVMVTVWWLRWWSLCGDHWVISSWWPLSHAHCVMASVWWSLMVTMWWPLSYGHCEMATEWSPFCHSLYVIVTVWWLRCDGHSVMGTVWWSLCEDHWMMNNM